MVRPLPPFTSLVTYRPSSKALSYHARFSFARNADPAFPGLPKPPSDEDSLAPLPLVTMISAPPAKKRKEGEDDKEDEVVEIKMEEVVAVKVEKQVDEEEKEGEMQVD